MTGQTQSVPTTLAVQSGPSSRALAATAIAWTAIALALWLAGFVLRRAVDGPVYQGLLGLAIFLAADASYLYLRRRTAAETQALAYLHGLAELDSAKRREPETAGANQLPAGDPWRTISAKLAERFDEALERARRAEHTLTTVEVRQRRSAAGQSQVESLLADLPEPVIAINSFDELILANAAAEELLHLNDAAVGQPIGSALACEPLVELLIETRRRKPPAQRSREIEFVDDLGLSRCFAVVARSLPTADASRTSSDHRATGAFALLRDISELKVGQKRYAEFVSTVSHEMKSPLSGIKAYIELLADCPAEDAAHREEFLEVIDSQANRLHRLIDNLLNIARIEAGVVEVTKESVSLNELLGEAVEIVRPAAAAKQIRLATELSPMYLGALADRDLLLQAAINLLSNAVKYTPERGSVVVRSRVTDEEIVFEVADTGVGLTEEDAVRVFEKFYRVKKDRNMAQGTGLGLPLAKHIVEDVHGGRITVESSPGAGSTFRVSLPAAAQLVS
ncbi:MAG TPA: ATP-binding protein [Pirellulales bacterium]